MFFLACMFFFILETKKLVHKWIVSKHDCSFGLCVWLSAAWAPSFFEMHTARTKCIRDMNRARTRLHLKLTKQEQEGKTSLQNLQKLFCSIANTHSRKKCFSSIFWTLDGLWCTGFHTKGSLAVCDLCALCVPPFCSWRVLDHNCSFTTSHPQLWTWFWC